MFRQDPAHEALRQLQQTLRSASDGRALGLVEALDTLAEREHWQRQFGSFPDFVFAQQPAGLGVRTQKALKLLRQALLEGGYIAEWVAVLESATRSRGRPRKKLISDENSRPVYVVTTAVTGIDRILLRLKNRHPEDFAAVCSGNCGIREAATQAGLIKPRSPTYGGACDLERVSGLSARAQGKLLCAVFTKSSKDAQCALIARHLEPHLGTDLAQSWRALGAEAENS